MRPRGMQICYKIMSTRLGSAIELRPAQYHLHYEVLVVAVILHCRLGFHRKWYDLSACKTRISCVSDNTLSTTMASNTRCFSSSIHISKTVFQEQHRGISVARNDLTVTQPVEDIVTISCVGSPRLVGSKRISPTGAGPCIQGLR